MLYMKGYLQSVSKFHRIRSAFPHRRGKRLRLEYFYTVPNLNFSNLHVSRMVGALKRRPSAARPIPIRRRSRLAAAAATQQPTTMPMAAATVTTGHRRHRHLTDMAAEGGRSLAVKYHSLIIYFINYLS